MLARFTKSRGLSTSYVVEQALLCFMAAHESLADEARVPARLLLDEETFDRLTAQLDAPPGPTDALRALMRGESS